MMSPYIVIIVILSHSSFLSPDLRLLTHFEELYESTEYSAVTINETWSQQLIRISQALGFFTTQILEEFFATLGIQEDASDSEKDDKA